MYFIIRYGLLAGEIEMSHFIISIVIGTILTILMIGSLFAMRKRMGVES